MSNHKTPASQNSLPPNTCSPSAVHNCALVSSPPARAEVRAPSTSYTLDLFSDPVPERFRIPVFQIHLVRERDHETEQIRSPADVARLASELVDGLDREAFYVIALSTANRVIGVHLAHLGTVDASVASPRECYKFALSVNARSIVCLHNHPSGNIEPSREDVAVSKQIKAAGEMIGIPLTDSLVVGYDGRYTSLAERGLLG